MPEAAPDRLPTEAREAAEAEIRKPTRYLPGFTWRVFGLFVVLTAIIVIWTEYSVLVVNSTSFNSLAPSITSVFALAVVAGLLNPILKAISRRYGLASRELACLYCMLMVASPVASIGMVHFMLPSMVSARYFASDENKWDSLFLQHIPEWYGPTGEREVTHFWESSPTASVPWPVWVAPLVFWSVLGLSLYFAMLCINVIIRKQWIENERLTFPLVYLPLEMAREEPARLFNAFFRNPLMWIGFVIAIIPQTMAGLHVYFPTMPEVPVKSYPLHPYFRSMGQPWASIGTFRLAFYPCMIGFSYLLTTEVSLSGWVFYLLAKAERIIGGAGGWTGRGQAEGFAGFPFEEQQGLGAWLVLIGLGIWIGREHVIGVLRGAFAPGAATRGPGDPLSYRAACIGFIAGLVVLLLWANTAGLSLLAAVPFFLLLFTNMSALTRIRAEAGLGCISGPMMVQDFMYSIVGTSAFGPRNLTVLESFRWFSREMRGAPTIMPCQLEALKIGHEAKIRGRDLAIGILVAIVITMVMGQVATLKVIYRQGGVTMNNWRFLDVPRTPFVRLAALLGNPKPTDWLSLSFVGIGGVIMSILTYLRIRFVWWPLHPIGFALAFTKRSVHWIWSPLLFAWLIKTSVIRYGGYKLYRTLLPFFLGLILGDFFIGGVFGIAGALVPRPGYCVFP
ncbi:MAG: DUF6785 family protein [Armatimonadota bacterium]